VREEDAMPRRKVKGKKGDGARENRKFPRRPIEIPVLYTIFENTTTHGGETGNISEGGLLLFLKEVLLEGMRLKVEIFPPEFFGLQPIRGVTQIVWKPTHKGEEWDEYFRHGLEFIEMDGWNSRNLKRLLRYIEG
jgi:hypothetical protein